MEKKVLKKLQNTELDILLEIDRICKKYDIKYFLMFGTLLGAVRHKGFIPWDDDIDIAMTREHYDKFLNVVEKELDAKYMLDSIKNNKKYYLPFIKIRNKLTCFEEKNSVNYNGPKGIWVDIFVFEDISLKNREGLLFKAKMKLASLMYAALVVRSLKIKSSWKVDLVSKIFSNRMLIKLIELITKGKRNSKNLAYYSSFGYSGAGILPKEAFYPVKEIEFEGHKFGCPNDADTILKFFYNDYMKLPPENERVTHNPLSIKFEDEEFYNFKD